MKTTPTTQKQVIKYNPIAAKEAKESLLKHVANYPKTITESSVKEFIKDGRECLKVFESKWLPIAELNKDRLAIIKKLKDKVVEAQNEINKIAALKLRANTELSLLAQNCEKGNELNVWNQYFEKFGIYTTYSFSDFEKLCFQYQLQKQKELEKEQLSEFEQLLNEPQKIESVTIADVQNVKFKTELIVDYSKVDAKQILSILVENGKAEQLTEMLRIALKDSKPNLDGVTYIEKPYETVR